MLLIMSGTYVEQELMAEFGKIPPSFLPLGNKRLFQHQFERFCDETKKYLSIPEGYDVLEVDKLWLNDNNIELIETPDKLSLGEAVIANLNLIGVSDNVGVTILFGDTLIEDVPIGDDVIAVAPVKDNYKWSTYDEELNSITWGEGDTHHLDVVCGFFNFSDPKELIRGLTRKKWDFVDGVNYYLKTVGLKPKNVKRWHDFGHVNTYYNSKASFTTQRAFNNLSINRAYVEKSSYKNFKLRAEANWFTSVPLSMRRFLPQYLGDETTDSDKFKYRLEYLFNISLSELYVFSDTPNKVWLGIIDCCLDFLTECASHKPNEEQLESYNVGTIKEQLFISKTRLRVREFCKSNNIQESTSWSYNGENVSLEGLIKMSERFLPDFSSAATVMHGDFCFSNIVYDFRSHRIKTFDPRGIVEGSEASIFGHFFYDIAKLSHSVIGLYDLIVAGYHRTTVNFQEHTIDQVIDASEKHLYVQKIFIIKIEEIFGIKYEHLLAMQIQLFLSMLPLHNDDKTRQNGLFANAFRIYQQLRSCIT